MIHGGDTVSYIKEYDGDIIDYSSNINPLGPPEGLKDEMDRAYPELRAYPDIQYRELRRNVARYIGCDARDVIVGNGALDIISNVSLLFNRTVTFTPCFSEYIKRPAVYGKQVLKLGLDNNFRIDLKLLSDKLCSGDLLILGNPNNPTGLRIPEKTLIGIYEIVKQKHAFLLLDEAFFEFCPSDYDSIELLRGADNVCIIRAATKFFALPGIRLGYGCTSDVFAQSYRNIENPWSVNAYANAAGRYIFKDKDYINRTKRYIKDEREYLINELGRIGWMRVFKSEANFILLKLLKYDEDIVFDRLIHNGIMIRKASSFEGLDKTYIRIAVKDHESNEKLIGLMKKLEQ